ncbi:unnamed protein product, partial [Ixodes pacificus]
MPPRRQSPPKRNHRSTRSQSANPAHGSQDGSPLPAVTPAGASGAQQPFGNLPPPPSGGMAPPFGPALPPPTAELVGALTSALRAAFPEVRPRHPRLAQMAQPFASATDEEDDNFFPADFAASQDPPG